MSNIEKKSWFGLESIAFNTLEQEDLRALALKGKLNGDLIYCFMQGLVEDEIKDGKRVHALSNYLLRDLKCWKRNSFFLSEVIRKCDDLLCSEIVFEPHFRYCCSVWGCAGTTEINRLQKLQNRAVRIVTNSSFDTHSNQLIEKLGWKTINELIDIESKTIVFKTLNELAPPYLCSLFRKNSQSTSYRLRNTSTDLRLPKKVQKTARNAFRLGV